MRARRELFRFSRREKESDTPSYLNRGPVGKQLALLREGRQGYQKSNIRQISDEEINSKTDDKETKCVTDTR